MLVLVCVAHLWICFCFTFPSNAKRGLQRQIVCRQNSFLHYSILNFCKMSFSSVTLREVTDKIKKISKTLHIGLVSLDILSNNQKISKTLVLKNLFFFCTVYLRPRKLMGPLLLYNIMQHENQAFKLRIDIKEDDSYKYKYRYK